MASHNLDKILADTEVVLNHTNPAFDITDEERQVARKHAEMMLALIAQCQGNNKEFVKAMISMVATAEAFTQWGRNRAGNEPSEFPDDETEFQGQEREAAIEAFDAQFGAVHRQHQIEQAVNAACFILLKENDTVLGKLSDVRRRIVSLMPWNWETKKNPQEKEVTAKIPDGMDAESALELASGQNFCEGGMCNDVRKGIVSLFIAEGADPEVVREQLKNIGFTVIETEKLTLTGRIRKLFTKGEK